jgi:hypothetical protein
MKCFIFQIQHTYLFHNWIYTVIALYFICVPLKMSINEIGNKLNKKQGFMHVSIILNVYCTFTQWPRFHVCLILPNQSLSWMLHFIFPVLIRFSLILSSITNLSWTPLHRNENKRMKTRPLGKSASSNAYCSFHTRSRRSARLSNSWTVIMMSLTVHMAQIAFANYDYLRTIFLVELNSSNRQVRIYTFNKAKCL